MKSHLKTYLEVATSIYLDACAKCVADVSVRDIKYIKSRVEKEGMSFLTITLPTFARDFERALAEGRVDSKLFRSFRKNRSIPAFLQGMTSRIFDVETGRINDVKTNDPPFTFSPLVESIRQICLAFKKIEIPCSPSRVRKAMDGFIAIEQSFDNFQLSESDLASFDAVSDVLWPGMLRHLRLDMLTLRHGPGATADGLAGNGKYRLGRWHDRLEPYFPVVDNGFAVSSSDFIAGETWLAFHPSELQDLQIVSESAEQPVKVVPVPKTLKTPRIIAIEPCCMQYAQQGLRDALYSVIESYWLTSGHVNFRDQSINQSLAMAASANGQLATIDLSDASDRVPRSLSLRMFRSRPDVLDAIEACRSNNANLPDGRKVVGLRKFASMGSALCFPVEAMYFYTICVVALMKEMHLPISLNGVFLATRDVYVYGDDILVPTRFATTVLDHLEKYNCKVNLNKTFWNGSFRESCGMDAYAGLPVTPVYIRAELPENRQQSHSLLSYVSSARQFFKAGMYRTSSLLFSRVERILGPLPECPDRSFVIGRNSIGLHVPRKRFNVKYQRVEVLAWVPAPVYRTDPLDGYAALQKSLLRLQGLVPKSFRNVSLPGLPTEMLEYLDSIVDGDAKHLERSALYGAVAIKRRWVPLTLLAGFSG